MRKGLILAVVAFAVGIGAYLWWGGGAQVRRTDPRFLTLGELAKELAKDPKVFDIVLEKMGAGRAALGLVPDAEALLLRQLFERADYRALDSRPRVTIEELRGAVGALAARQGPPKEPPPVSPAKIEPLGLPTGEAAPQGEPFLSSIGLGLMHGDRLDPEKAARFRDSERFAKLLDRLALNRPGEVPYEVDLGSVAAATPDALVAALTAMGHIAAVRDERFAANFGDLEREGKPVATPLWVKSGITVGGDELAVPVPHIQVTLEVRGPRVNADVSLYNSLDFTGSGEGGTKFRAEVTKDQPWVGGLVYRRYEKQDAIEAVRLMGLLRRYADDRVRAAKLPLDGYFALGVCTLAPAVVEQKITGATTIWPLTQDPAQFPGDSEIERLVRALPVDGRGAAPDRARVLASLPWRMRAEVPFPALRGALAKLGWNGKP